MMASMPPEAGLAPAGPANSCQQVFVAAFYDIVTAAENGVTVVARIGMLRALNRHVEQVFNSSRKATHWGKRKLKWDE